MIVDASLGSYRFAETDFSRAADPFRSLSDLIALGFLLVETANALHKRSRAGRLAAEKCIKNIDLLRRSIFELVPDAELLSRAVALALAKNHPVYDCLSRPGRGAGRNPRDRRPESGSTSAGSRHRC